jgi:CDP-diacylglycerol---glycerol-3-phosphate 3-phosphatidyltransferase
VSASSLGRLALVSALGLAAASMLVYALRGGETDADARRKGATFFLGAGDFLLHWFMWLLFPLERLALRLHLRPDFFNFAGLALGALSGALIAFGRLELGGVGILLGGVCDILDGRLARRMNVDSPYGKFIDSTLDRFVEVFALLGFVFYLRAFPYGALLASAALSGSLLVSYARARGEVVGVLCREGLMQRGERVALLCLACFVDRPLSARLGRPEGFLSLWVLGVIAAASLGTAAYRTAWIARRLREERR